MNRAILSVVVVVLAAYATAAVVPSVDRMLGAELDAMIVAAYMATGADAATARLMLTNA